MRDQYDDGRYDGWGRNMGISQSPSPQMAHTSIGYLPITAVRGGIKYPSKGTPVAKNTEALQRQLDELTRSHEATGRNIERMKKELAKSKRPAPPADQTAWTIDVRFAPSGQLYNYLILRHNGMFYTTGTGSDGKFFSWTQVLAWLDTMASHSALLPLKADYSKTAPLEGRNC